MMLASCRPAGNPAGKLCRIPGLCLLILVYAAPASGQLNILHQEGFNDDGDGTRYTMLGRGQEVLPVGPGMWEHSFNVDVIGLPAIAPARRAAVLWSSNILEFDFTDESLQIWDNLIDYMLDGKEGATVGFLPDVLSNTADFLSFRLEDAGHSWSEIGTALPDPSEVDLVIHTETAVPEPNTAFADYPVPVITFNAGNHDDTLVSSIGAVTTGGPTTITIVEENQDHPVVAGLTGTIAWLDDFAEAEPLQGVGVSVPPGSTTLATYIDPDTEAELPALLLVEEGESLLGAFAPVPEGEGYIVGGDMNERFPDELGEFTTEDTPRVLQLNPVDVSGETGVKVAVGLAASDVDFESPDFLRVSYGEDPDGEFVTLAQFDGMPPGVLIDPELGALNPIEFTDFTFDIPDDVNNLIIRFEAFSTFPNEVLGIDNVRIFTGEAVDPLDCNGDGAVDFADLDCGNEAGITDDLLTNLNLIPGDLDGQDGVAFADFLILSANFGQPRGKYTEGDIDGSGDVAFPDFLALSANFGRSAEATAAAVPEPAGVSVLALGGLLPVLARRRRRR